MRTPRWVRETKASRMVKAQKAVSSARKRVDARFDVAHGEVGELSTGALLLRLADLAERTYHKPVNTRGYEGIHYD